MIEWAQVGRRVVCIREFEDSYLYLRGEIFPILKQILTIRESFVENGLISFYFEEIVNPIQDYREKNGEIGFRYYYFKPVKETNIECFTSILENLPSDDNKEKTIEYAD